MRKKVTSPEISGLFRSSSARFSRWLGRSIETLKRRSRISRIENWYGLLLPPVLPHKRDQGRPPHDIAICHLSNYFHSDMSQAPRIIRLDRAPSYPQSPKCKFRHESKQLSQSRVTGCMISSPKGRFMRSTFIAIKIRSHAAQPRYPKIYSWECKETFDRKGITLLVPFLNVKGVPMHCVNILTENIPESHLMYQMQL